MVSPMGSKRWKIVVYEPLTQDLAHRTRRQLVLARPTYFLIYQFNLRRFGDHFWGWGSLAFVWLGRCGR